MFCEDNGLETECKEHTDFIAALERLEQNGIIEKEDNLYFLRMPNKTDA